MIIAFLGDVVGKSGRRAAAGAVPRLRSDFGADIVIANLENAAGGYGLTEKALGELERAGIEFFTSGNHIWDKKEGVALVGERKNIVRPANYPSGAPGSGFGVARAGNTSVAVFNIQGRVFMPPLDCPFRTIDRLLAQAGDSCKIRLVDFHAEATSEKKAMGWYLDGRVSVVLGTHTHVRTGDARLLPKGTAYVTDVGMTGSNDSVLGLSKEPALRRFLEMRPVRLEVARGDLRSDVLIVDVDEGTGRATRVEHVQIEVEES